MMILFQVFNIFFIKGNEKKHVVHCLRCARLASKDLSGWICLGMSLVISSIRLGLAEFRKG